MSGEEDIVLGLLHGFQSLNVLGNCVGILLLNCCVNFDFAY